MRFLVIVTVCAIVALSAAPSPATEAQPDVESQARSVLLVGVSGTTLSPSAATHLRAGGRGIILFTPNLRDAPDLRAMTAEASCAANAPILIAVDQEPGRIARLRGVGVPSPDAQSSPDLAGEAGLMARRMRALGVNFDLAPVLDIPWEDPPVLSGRTLGNRPATVSTVGRSFIRGLEAHRVAASAKHFPGLGRAVTDPHITVTNIDAHRLQIDADLEPFRGAVATGVRTVMMSHGIYDALDPDLPASLSPAVVGLLRDELGFDGVIVTDALGMAGVRSGRSVAEAATRALMAGVDLLIIEDPALVEAVTAAIVSAVQSERLSPDRLADASTRVTALAAWAAPVRCRSGVRSGPVAG